MVVRAVLGMQTSADRAYRHYNPAPSVGAAAAAATTTESKLDSVESGDGSSRSKSGSGSGKRGEADGVKKSASSVVFPSETAGTTYEVGTFSDGISGDQTLCASAVVVANSSTTEKSPLFSPRRSSNKSEGGFSDGSSTAGWVGSGGVRRRSWASRQDRRINSALAHWLTAARSPRPSVYT